MKTNIQTAVDPDFDDAQPANANNKTPRPGISGGITPGQLKQYIERIEAMEQAKSNLASDIREVFAEAKGSGFDIKTMRHIIKLRKMDPEQRAEQEELLELYLHAIGMN